MGNYFSNVDIMDKYKLHDSTETKKYIHTGVPQLLKLQKKKLL